MLVSSTFVHKYINWYINNSYNVYIDNIRIVGKSKKYDYEVYKQEA